MSPGTLPERMRHEAMGPLCEVERAIHHAQEIAARARTVGTWGLQGREYYLDLEKALVRATLHVGSLQMLAATTPVGSPL